MNHIFVVERQMALSVDCCVCRHAHARVVQLAHVEAERVSWHVNKTMLCNFFLAMSFFTNTYYCQVAIVNNLSELFN